MKIVIIDYGLGNLRSVQKSFERANIKVKISSDINILYSGGTNRLEYHGGLAGRFSLNSFNAATISNFDISGNITRAPTALGDRSLGGIVGYFYGANSNPLTISGVNTRSGNVSGAGGTLSNGFGNIDLRNNTHPITISNVSLTGNVIHTESSAIRTHIGGFAGQISLNAGEVTISNISTGAKVEISGPSTGWGQQLVCEGNCNAMEMVSNLIAGDYSVTIQTFNPYCYNRVTVTVTGGGNGNPCDGQGGDSDGDGICDNQDNCDFTPNPDQADNDADGIGNACDDTPNGNGGDVDCNDAVVVGEAEYNPGLALKIKKLAKRNKIIVSRFEYKVKKINPKTIPQISSDGSLYEGDRP